MELSSAGIFPILVVDAWDGRRWIETVNGEFGKPAWGVQIGHTTTDGGPVVLVSTIRKDEFFEYESSTEPDPLVVVAYVGLFNLLNATFPGFSGEMRERYSRALPKFANREAKRAPEWPTVPWTVDGVPIRPHLFFFCGAWVAVADELPLITLGDGQSADEIHLVHDTDSRLAKIVRQGAGLSYLMSQDRPHHAGFSLPRNPQADHYDLLALELG